MKMSLTLLAVVTGTAALSACDDPAPRDRGDDMRVEADAAADAGVETAAPEAAPSPVDTAKSSEESVQPESETLFY
jgi:hypothetical protein